MSGLAEHIGQAVAPLTLAMADRHAMEDLLDQIGFPVLLDDDAHASIADVLGVAASITTIADALAALVTGTGEPLGHATAILDAADDLVQHITDLADLDDADVASLVSPFDDPATWAEISRDLAVHLLMEHLRTEVVGLFTVLAITGIISPPEEQLSWGDRRLELDLDRLLETVTDPGARLSAQFGWDDDLDAYAVLWWVQEVVRAIGGFADVRPIPQNVLDDVYGGALPAHPAIGTDIIDLDVVDDATGVPGHLTVGAFVSPLGPVDDPAGDPVGFYIGPTLWGSASAAVDLGGTWWLDLDTELDASGASGISIRPGSITHETTSPAPSGSAAVRFEPSDPVTLLGGSGVELVLHGLRVGVSVDDQLQPIVEVDATGSGLELRIGADEPDGLIGTILGRLDVSVNLALGLDIGADGIAFRGGVGLTLSRSVDIPIGPFTIRTISVALEAGTNGVTLGGVLDIDAALGPFTVAVGGIGADLAISEVDDSDVDDGAFGLGIAVHGGFVPPTTIAFDLEAEGVSGGGIVHVDGTRYIGGLTLDIVQVGVDALVVIDTALPDDPGGFSLFASLSLRFPGIPLGFGFSLTGLGGLLALNRSIDAEALALGLRDGAADSIMFPDDPVRDALLIVGQLDDYFPIQAGNTVIGPLAEITWGPSGLVTGQLGVIVSLPQGVIVVLGSLEAILPDPSAPALELHLDTLGAIDLVNGTVLVVASLYDSRLLGTIELSGDAAVYLSVLDKPYFVLSVGGFHPGFEPPGHTPDILEALRRMRAEIDLGSGVSASIEAYFAVTSNTVQFGGGFEIEASADFLLTTYSARGWFDFDVLLQFSPFLIVADASAGVGVFANDKELLGVDLSVHLEGPKPWYAQGDARFTFFGIKVKFDFAVGGNATPELRVSSNVLDLMITELQSPAAWTARHASGITAGLQLAGNDIDARLRPDDVIIVAQTVAPLGYRLDKYGETIPVQEDVTVASVSIVDPTAGTSIGEIDVDDHLDWFAPAQYTTMRDTDRLSAPSYELLTAGVTIGADGIGLPVGDRLDVPVGHETDVWDPSTGTLVASGVVEVTRPFDLLFGASAGAHAARAASGVKVIGDHVEIAAEGYVVIDALTGETTSTEQPFADAVRETTGPDHRVVVAQTGETS